MLPLQQFQDFIRQYDLFAPGSRVLLAVSGGRDSVLMAEFFSNSGYTFGIAHCNFNLRGDESLRDEKFVADLAERMGVSFHRVDFDTKKYAQEHKISTQMAARDLRYRWFEEIRAQEGYEVIALAQHQNDAIETLLINLIRGTGISGLHGILPKRGKLIRPLLFLNRAEIDRLIEENKYEYVEDSSNLSTHYMRNKLRLDVIPGLKELNPNLEQTFAGNIERFTEIEQFLQVHVARLEHRIREKRTDGYYFSISEIKKLEPRKLLLFELLKPFGFSQFVVNDLLDSLDGNSGLQFYSDTHQILINRGQLIVLPLNKNAEPQPQFIERENTSIQFGDCFIEMFFSDKTGFEKLKNKAYTDAGKLIFPLEVRSWQEGDKFKPLGMEVYKKLSDLFVDEKIALHMKSKIPVLLNGNGEIIWVAGLRQDNRYKITSSTKKVAIFEIK